MSAFTVPAPVVIERQHRSRLGYAIWDTLAITQRNLQSMVRTPEMLVFSTIQPVLFVLMFRYVFGGAISVPGVPYVDFLMPGIWAQTITFGAMSTGVGLAEDMAKGLVERFRSLPMARSAVLAGRTMADLTRNVFVVALMVVVGFLVGWRLGTNVAAFLAAMVLLLLFSFSLSWGFALIGLSAPNAETAQAMSFPLLAPLVFASSAFVPVDTMPGWLQPFARNQPLSVTVDAVRALTIGGPTTEYVVKTILWCVGLIAVFAPLAVAKYRRTA